MAKHLNTHVHVTDDVGENHVFGPGDSVPAWARRKITNPHVWDTEGTTSPGESATSPSGEEVPQGPPPMSGSGSGRDAWAAYAARNDVEVPADAKREDIVDALTAAGVPTTGEGGE